MSAPPRIDRLSEQSAFEEPSARIVGIRRQALFRDVSEQLGRIASSFAIEEPLQLLCECGQAHCLAPLSVSP
jgi:hypothetical protein